MPSEAPVYPTQPEKPQHYTYLKEFRTQQCPLFLQHKCTQHRPFTCFHWHFLNQRRRRPIRKRDGTFNYNPDVYCTKYDETTGICPEGDDCAFLHRTAGDTERRYHLRYYKTGTCVHETDSKGHCVKNGPHCAFAHGAHDLRQPVYDIREMQAQEVQEKQLGTLETTAATQLEKDRMVNEDPKWNDTNYVLACYKTEQCKRPPRLCRQGYACPSYHNSRDRRRSPKKFKYRSTPCPNVKHGDDWGDPTQCDNGDNCPYCHTRTEQQFHPEIYKSTKCNDMVQTGYCPRGPFCAFAHVEQEMMTQREMNPAPDNSLAAFVTNALPNKENDLSNGDDKLETNGDNKMLDHPTSNGMTLATTSPSTSTQQTKDSFLTNNTNIAFPEPIGKGRSNSLSNTSGPLGSDLSQVYNKAPGTEREDNQFYMHTKLRQQMQSIEDDPILDQAEKSKRKQNLLLLHNLNVGSPISSGSIMSSICSTPTTPSSTVSSTMSPHAPSFYPPGDTVESVIGNALDEDLNLGELTLSAIDRELGRKENDNDTNSVCSSYSTGFPSAANAAGSAPGSTSNSNSYFGPSSLPVTIPSSSQHTQLGSLSQSPVSSPLGSSLSNSLLPQHLQQQKQEQQLQEAAVAFLSHPNPGKYSAPGFSDYNSMSPRSNSVSQSPLLGSFGGSSGINGFGEVQRLRDELAVNKSKLSQWEEGITQARGACEAWKKEAEEANRKAKILEEERLQAIKQRDEAVQQVGKLKAELDHIHCNPFLHRLNQVSELDSLPVTLLKTMQAQLRLDMETLEKIIYQQTAMKCLVCQEKNRNVAVLPCNHYVLCQGCAAKQASCPYCHTTITQRTNMVMPM